MDKTNFSKHNSCNNFNSFSQYNKFSVINNLRETEKFLCAFVKSSNFLKIYNIIKNKK